MIDDERSSQRLREVPDGIAVVAKPNLALLVNCLINHRIGGTSGNHSPMLTVTNMKPGIRYLCDGIDIEKAYYDPAKLLCNLQQAPLSAGKYASPHLRQLAGHISAIRLLADLPVRLAGWRCCFKVCWDDQ